MVPKFLQEGFKWGSFEHGVDVKDNENIKYCRCLNYLHSKS